MVRQQSTKLPRRDALARSSRVLSAILCERVMMMSLRKSLSVCSFGSLERFSRWWWAELLWYVTGISVTDTYSYQTPGWCKDVYTFYHRGRYGWAPRDTWCLDDYYNHVFAGSLDYLANHHWGCPQAYFDETQTCRECHEWDVTLRRWATAFSESPNDVDIYDAETDYRQHHAEQTRRRENIHAALKEMEPVWEYLWD